MNKTDPMVGTRSQDERIMAALAHASAILPMWGAIAAIVIWATQREKSAFTAAVCPRPAAACTNPVPICTGPSELTLVPSPSSPETFLPHAHTVPSVFTPQLWKPPALTCVNVPAGGVAWP